jgi:pilus assembly protein CpaB
MNRDTRTLIVVLVAVLTGGAAAYAVREYVRAMPAQQVPVQTTNVVVATRSLAVGTRIAPADVKLVPWPQNASLPGSFNNMETVVNRGLTSAVDVNEPITAGKLAPIEAGAGLSPTIPEGMRAISVQVNEVVGVAGFVTPGTRVDVMATFRRNNDGLTRVVVSNVQVLTAGTKLEQDQNRASNIPSSVVTLLLSPADAEKVVLAANEGQLMLALRNPLDASANESDGTRATQLFGAPPPPPAPAPAAPRPAARPKVESVAPPPPPPAPTKPYTVETIRAAKRAEEAVHEP